MQVENTSREVIESKLLTALDDRGTVAILASEEDLDTLIDGLTELDSPKASELQKGLEKLRVAAFGKRKR